MTVHKARFFISWLLTAVTMFSLSYVWHGIVLNDFERLSYPRTTFLSLAVIVYLGIALALVALNSFLEFNRKPIYKGIILGVILGFFIYLVAFVLGVSFSSSPQFAQIALDVAWQVFEQGCGGLVCGLIFDFHRVSERI